MTLSPCPYDPIYTPTDMARDGYKMINSYAAFAPTISRRLRHIFRFMR